MATHQSFSRLKTLDLSNIQFLRAAAASLVVMEHSFARGQSYGFAAHNLVPLLGFGSSGVDLFFVISGFIMSYSQSKTPKSPKEFIVGRFVRIVPLYWAWMALIVAIMVVMPGVFRTTQFDIHHIFYSSLFLSQAALNEPPFIDLGWTLEFEFLFYILFAFTLFLDGAKRQRFTLGAGLLTFALVFHQYIVLEFLFGVAAFFFLPVVRRYRLSIALTVAGVFSFCITHVYFSDIDRLWKWGMPAFLLVQGLAAMRGGNSRVLSYLGNASYSIYLVQFASIPVFYKGASIMLASYGDNEGGLLSLGDLLIIFSIAFSLVAGVLLYEILEKPVTDLTRRFQVWRRDC